MSKPDNKRKTTQNYKILSNNRKGKGHNASEILWDKKISKLTKGLSESIFMSQTQNRSYIAEFYLG